MKTINLTFQLSNKDYNLFNKNFSYAQFKPSIIQLLKIHFQQYFKISLINFSFKLK